MDVAIDMAIGYCRKFVSNSRIRTGGALEERADTAPVRLVVGPVRVLIVEPDAMVRRTLSQWLSGRGIHVMAKEDAASAVDAVDAGDAYVALIDLTEPEAGGSALLERIVTAGMDLQVVAMTAAGDARAGVRAVRAGAYHFVEKPFRSSDEVLLVVEKAAERRTLILRNRSLAERLDEHSGEPSGVPPLNAPTTADWPLGLPYRQAKRRAIAAFEMAYFEAVLRVTRGNVSEAARRAGLDRSNFRRAARRAGVTSRD